MSYTNADLTSVEFRDALADNLNRVQHRGERLLVTRKGKPAVYVVPVETISELDSYLRSRDGLSHVTVQVGEHTMRITRDTLAADLTKRATEIGGETVQLSAAEADVISTLLAEFAVARADALAALADDWATRLHNRYADAEERATES